MLITLAGAKGNVDFSMNYTKCDDTNAMQWSCVSSNTAATIIELAEISGVNPARHSERVVCIVQMQRVGPSFASPRMGSLLTALIPGTNVGRWLARTKCTP